MRRIGISLYPEKSTIPDMLKYLEQAKSFGAARIFSCLLSVQKSKVEIVQEFSEINAYAHELGYEVIVDVAPRVFESLDISYKDLSFFKCIGADGFRLDVGFSGAEEALMTYNPQGLLVEINMSNDVSTINTIMDYKPNRYKLYGCHNFYPHAHTGLDLDYFKSCTRRFSANGLKTAAFVTSQNKDTFGPWPVTQGLPTLEMHRALPIDVQVKHYVALDIIDDILISNCYPSKAEMKALQNVNLEMLNLQVDLIEGLSAVETSIVLDEMHFNRGDKNSALIRSTQSRVKYKGHTFELHNPVPEIKRGDVLIESSLYGHYAGELQIALCDMPNSGMTNVVGHVRSEELFLLDCIAPWQKFRLSL